MAYRDSYPVNLLLYIQQPLLKVSVVMETATLSKHCTIYYFISVVLIAGTYT